MLEKLKVKIPTKNYDIIIGQNAVNQLEDFLKKSNYSKVFIITDENVAKFHLSNIQNVINKTEIQYITIAIAAGEKSKSFQTLEKLSEDILDNDMDRKSLIVALGGGVVGDLSGFCASILMRGIDFIQIPTTLLAMVDSSVGGKTAINSSLGKNLIGSFYQPKLVICDTKLLNSLPSREFLCGYAEIVKYGFIKDKKFFKYLKDNHEEIFKQNEENLNYIIKKSCEIKAKVVSQDEKENGLRAILNFGHTFGHTFEAEANYSNKILHGEAVALGMAMAAKMSLNLQMISQDDYEEITSYLRQCGFILDVHEFGFDYKKANLVKHLFKDKKTIKKQLTFILLKKLGQAVIEKNVDVAEFEKVIDEFLGVG